MYYSDNNIYISAILIYNDSMNFDFSLTKNPLSTASIALKTVYTIHADPSYDVSKGGILNEDLIAIRTIGGMGIIKIDGLEDVTVLPGSLLFVKHKDIRRYYCSCESWDFWWFEFLSNNILSLPLNKQFLA